MLAFVWQDLHVFVVFSWLVPQPAIMSVIEINNNIFFMQPPYIGINYTVFIKNAIYIKDYLIIDSGRLKTCHYPAPPKSYYTDLKFVSTKRDKTMLEIVMESRIYRIGRNANSGTISIKVSYTEIQFKVKSKIWKSL